MVHLTQIDSVISSIEKGDRPYIFLIGVHAGRGELSAIHYMFSSHPLTLEHMRIAVTFACRFGRLKVIQYVCELRNSDDRTYRYNPALDHNEAIQIAAEKGYLDIVRYLCQLKNDNDDDNEGRGGTTYRCNPSDQQNYAILQAAKYGRLEVLKYLCQLKNYDGSYRCDPSDLNNMAMTWALNRGHLDIFRYLRDLKNDDGSPRCIYRHDSI